MTRRSFFKLGAAAATLATIGVRKPILAGAVELKSGWADVSLKGVARTAVPSSCWQCVVRDGIIGYVEDGRLVKIEGNPNLLRTSGVICARGQAGVNQVYDPDRILYPMRRVGARGEGKWKRITWDDALDELTARLKKLRDDGTPEKFMFHYGRMKGSDSTIVTGFFLPAYGTKTIGNHTSICEGGKWTAQELTWGKHYDVFDVSRSKFILNFGCNPLEAHTNHVPFAQRLAAALGSGVPLVTFDVRLSNTAAKSREWIPIKPGTDKAVILAMCKVILDEGLQDTAFIETWTTATVEQLKEHLKKYTPKWAEKVSGVPASTITRLAKEFATTKPSVCVTYRGLVAHQEGADGERASLMLEALCGNIDVPGGRARAVGPKWVNSYKKPDAKPKALALDHGIEHCAYPTHHVSHQIFKVIKEGKEGRPDVYMFYCHNPVYVNGECQENIDVMKDETLLPFSVAVTPFMSESAALADLILPDVTYLERWTLDDMASHDQISEWYIRQPIVKPLGESRQFQDVCIDIAKRLGIDLPFNSSEEFIKDGCENTPEIKAVGGFEYMKKYGAWYDKNAKGKYRKHEKEVKPEDLKDAILDEKTGVWWKGKAGEDYTTTKDAFKKYVGQKIGDKVYVGFAPDAVNKSGKFEIYSTLLKMKGHEPMPSYEPIAEHEAMKEGELHLTTFKVAFHTQSRTANCKWLTEIYHDNPMWINPKTAAARGIANGDKVRLKSPIGEIVTTARVTEGIHPQVVAISMSVGHWEYGRYASGKEVFPEVEGEKPTWDTFGKHPNWLIANKADHISGQMRWNDTVVTVEKA
ncbi:MAG: hypothetical protein A3G34_15870 [Candidatus Lindowbacteria bacterium RIFCSPLOWO2_12_FULL_62_27]|nr:MAG: hypothetical protein A3G34_15870 [Candidatus Lindowbacteria bacterium RIFCSPLOWO2_12_FULL_62_27]OGH63677.1 MAG: hypothetical protein A3I06_06850 [Candidatus Lindowbacteria bacterium RIFCSPLOWO2_02_FULL_62_12]